MAEEKPKTDPEKPEPCKGDCFFAGLIQVALILVASACVLLAIVPLIGEQHQTPTTVTEVKLKNLKGIGADGKAVQLTDVTLNDVSLTGTNKRDLTVERLGLIFLAIVAIVTRKVREFSFLGGTLKKDIGLLRNEVKKLEENLLASNPQTRISSEKGQNQRITIDITAQ